ncbi:hypothetical protein FACS1894199_03080 [Bacteroidia bacterium]|nr:hypothetical protein FACS1894199_03080 [Bacteroidia bacterium]
MATIYLSLSAKVDVNKQQEILIRFTHGRINQRAKTNIFVPPICWNKVTQQINIPNTRRMNDDQKEFHGYLISQNEKLNALKTVVQKAFCGADKNAIPSNWLKLTIATYLFPDKYAINHDTIHPISPFFEIFDEFLEKHKISLTRKRNFFVLKRALQRYELFVAAHECCNFKLELNSITIDTIIDFEQFLRNEHKLCDEFKWIYDQFPAAVLPRGKILKPQPRGTNTINTLFAKLQAFFNWCLNNEKTLNRPFKNYVRMPDLYGTPYYISKEERNQIYETDLSACPRLAIQRDIFVFQCLVGCRIGDFYKMTRQNVIDGVIEYIPRKTRDGHPITIRVPLIDLAKELVAKYEMNGCKMLFPFVCRQRYNNAIKKIFKRCGITRNVTIIDSLTRESIIRPLNEIASSHIARRSFVGIMYKQVKDQNLVGALSGHIEGSKAFSRYREIDEDMKIELVKLLE